MGKRKQLIIVEKVGKDEIEAGFNGEYAELWPMAVVSVLEAFVKMSKSANVSDVAISKTLASMVKVAIEEAGGLKDAVDEVIEDESIS